MALTMRLKPREKELLTVQPPQSLKKPQTKTKRKYQIRKRPITRTSFPNTPLGCYLRRFCPIEYELIIKAKKERMGISADLVESIAYHSDNPFFQSVEFRKALSDYRKYKCRTPNKVKFNLDEEIATIKRQLRYNHK